MRLRDLLVLAGMLTVVLVPGDNALGQRGGRGGGVAAGGRAGGRAAVGPYGGAGAGYRSSGTVVGPAGGSRTAGTAGGSYTTGRGTTVNYGGAGRTATGPYGATAGRGVGGVQVTTPRGQTATKVGTAGGVRGPGGAAVGGGRSVGATSGPYGSGVSASRGGAAIGPHGGAVAGGTRVGTATGAGGRTVSGASHWGAASTAYGGYRSASRGVAVGGAGHYTGYRSATAMRTQGAYVRTGFAGSRYFNAGWYRSYPRAWRAVGWTGWNAWRWAPYATVATFCAFPTTPVIYDYGSNLIYEDNRVYYDGEMIATADAYATQALDLATAGQEAKLPEKEEWQALGVFAMVKENQQDSNNLFQIAINRNGVIRGNYINSMTDTTIPIYGSVDRKTQRAAWIVGDKKDVVYETGVGNLAQPEKPLLVHRGKTSTQQWLLVRLEPPKDTD